MPRTVTRWPPHWDGTQKYDLSHVYPFTFDVTLPASDRFAERIVEVQVSFSSHTFTRECPAGDVPHTAYSTSGDPRAFDHERYGLSKLLRDIFESMGNRRCFFTRHDNFFVVELPAGIPADSEYWIFFFLERGDGPGRVNLIVQSAYVGQRAKSPAGRKAKKVTFNTLVTKALLNQRPARPP